MPPASSNRISAVLILIGTMLKNLTSKSGLFSAKAYAAILIVGGILQISG